jgi:membrane protease YdiL (CAAX protease family)
MNKQENTVKYLASYAVYLLVVWGFYRFLFTVPDEVEELVIKPLIWLTPIFIILSKERESILSLGINLKNLFPTIYYSLFLGMLFAIEGFFINYLKYGGLDFSANLGKDPFFVALGLSFSTAITEELSFRGYLYNRVLSVTKNEFASNISTSLVWGLVHLPISIFWWKLTLGGVVGYFILTVIFGIGSAYVFTRTKNIISSILLHVFWEWPIILFR